MENFYNAWTVFVLVLISVHLIESSEEHIPKTRVRRQYYVCPPEFKRISHNCYYFSKNATAWQNAHWDCKEKHSQLTTQLTAAEDRKLRTQLMRLNDREEWWIDGIYDWKQMKWKWGTSGKKVVYHGFSRMGPEDREKLQWHCIILDPLLGYKWSARNCVLAKKYICQTRVNRVNERGLEKLRQKFNVDQNTKLNEIPAPLYMKTARHPRREHDRHGNLLKRYRPNGINGAYGHSPNATEVRRERKDRKHRKGKGRRNRKNRTDDLIIAASNATSLNITYSDDFMNIRKRKHRNRRNKNKERSSRESSTVVAIPAKSARDSLIARASIEDITQKTTYLDNSISPLHPKIIVEEHDFNL